MSKPSHTDSSDLARFGYKQELKRSMGSFSSFAAGFSYISILTGLFQTFYLGYAAGGPLFFWSWPIVLCGQFLVALCFAELAAEFPLSGGVYQWAKYVGSPALGWITGWIYLACLITSLAAVALALETSLPQISTWFQWVGNVQNINDVALNAVVLGCILIALSTLINSMGIRLLATINNIGVFAELAGIIILIVLLALHAVRDPLAAVVFAEGNASANDAGPTFGMNTLLAACALTAGYVLYGYDTAGSLAEETHDPRKRAPRAILQALSAAGIAGLLVLLLSLMAVQNLYAPELGNAKGGLPLLIKTVLGEPLGKLFLCDVIFSIFVCALAVHSGVVRLMFAMSRDNQLPFSKTLGMVSPKTHTPIMASIVCGIGAVLILVANVRFPKVIELVTSIAILWANLAYFIVVTAMLIKRLKTSGEKTAPTDRFTVGKWGLPVNVLAVCWGFFMVVNVAWPRTATYGAEWYNQWAALIYTLVLLVVGGSYYSFIHIKKKSTT
jgi:urea carboxylase system permease